MTIRTRQMAVVVMDALALFIIIIALFRLENTNFSTIILLSGLWMIWLTVLLYPKQVNEATIRGLIRNELVKILTQGKDEKCG